MCRAHLFSCTADRSHIHFTCWSYPKVAAIPPDRRPRSHMSHRSRLDDGVLNVSLSHNKDGGARFAFRVAVFSCVLRVIRRFDGHARAALFMKLWPRDYDYSFHMCYCGLNASINDLLWIYIYSVPWSPSCTSEFGSSVEYPRHSRFVITKHVWRYRIILFGNEQRRWSDH